MSNFLLVNNIGLALGKIGYLKEDVEEFDHLEDYLAHAEYVHSEVIGHLKEALKIIEDKEKEANE